jgi:hypothetical protein
VLLTLATTISGLRPEREEAWTVATLWIDLRSGFDRDAAEIWIDQSLRWREDAVTTKFTLDLAASVPLEVPDGSADLRIVLPHRRIEHTVEARAAGETHVAVRVVNGVLVVEQPGQAPLHLAE